MLESLSAPAGAAPGSDPSTAAGLRKAPTGIRGFDGICAGGLPQGRPTLVTGAAGAGKTLFATEFLLRGVLEFGEPGVLLAFEESAEDLSTNMASLGFDLPALVAAGQLRVESCRIRPSEVVMAGGFDLEALFVRLEAAVAAVGAKRVVLDTIEVLLGAFENEGVVRGELARLFEWLKERGLTTVVTGERGRKGELTRYGIEEYVSDCVIALDQRVHEEVSTRRLRVVKYRGSVHGTNEYPFLITDRGFLVLPITGVGLTYPASQERVSTGIGQLDQMLGGGIFRGSTLLVTGTAGTGKTTIVAQLVAAACSRGERALLVSFEESPDQLVRNLASVGIDLRHWLEAGLLRIWAERATAQGLEEHLGRLDRLLEDFQPSMAALDALGSLSHVGSDREVTATVEREIDLMKSRGITSVLTALTHQASMEDSTIGVTSITDTWLLLRNVESDGERNRLLFVIKSRGMAHSNQVREFRLTDRGAELVEVAIGPAGVLTGSARQLFQARQQALTDRRDGEIQRRRRALERRTAQVEEQIAALREQLSAEAAELDTFATQEALEHQAEASLQRHMEEQRGGIP
ncbi:circadian clock protein KaiC [Cyanobium sp. FGCU-52]|nr:circadian clock protein KaiC [Cyanobium sp. FGCU52]